jgi:formiminoglutamase
MPEDPRWPRASSWLAGAHDADPIARLGVVGVPVRLGSISGGRFDLAPAAVRKALSRFSTFDIETGIDVNAVAAEDRGDLPLDDARPEDALGPLAGSVRGALDGLDAVVLLGGDNSVTRPGVHGVGADLDRVGLLTVDAHLDLRDTAGGLSNGNPVRALLEDGLPGGNVAQVGIQSFANSSEYAAVATAAGVTVLTLDTVRADGMASVVTGALDLLAERVDALYVDLDLDVLDRASAPASPGSRPGGLSPGELRTAARLCGRHPKVRAIDIVELDPTQDVADVTVLTAASCLLSFAAGLAGR